MPTHSHARSSRPLRYPLRGLFVAIALLAGSAILFYTGVAASDLTPLIGLTAAIILLLWLLGRAALARRRPNHIRDAEAKLILDTLLNHLPIGVTIADAPEVRIRRVSQCGIELVGVPPNSQEQGRACETQQAGQIFHPDGRTPARFEELPLTRATINGELVVNEEWLIHTPDGHKIPLLCDAAPIRDKAGRITGGLVAWRDITEMKRALHALQHSEMRMRRLLDANLFGIALGELDGRINYANDCFLDLLGCTRQEVEAGLLRWDQLGPAGWLDPEGAAGRVLRDAGRIEPFQREFIRNDGSRVPVLIGALIMDEPGAKPAQVLAFCLERPEQRRAEQLRETLAAIVENSDDAIVSKTLDGTITTWNRAAERLFGYHSSEVIGKDISVIVPADHAGESQMIISRLKRGERIEHYETVRLRKDGRRIDVSVSVSPITNERGEIVGASKIARDITERKRLDDELARSHERFRRAAHAAGAMIYEIDPQTQKVLRTEGLTELTGYKSDETDPSVQWWLRLIHPDDQERVRQAMRQGMAVDGHYTVEYRLFCKSGEIREVWDRAAMSRDADESTFRIVGTVSDITQRKRAEAALMHSEQRFRSLVAATTSIVWTTGAEGGFIEPQSSWEAFTGQTPAEYEGFGWADAIHHDDRAKVLKSWMTAVRGAGTYDTEYRLRRRDGEWRHMRVRATPVLTPDHSVREWVGMCTDITDQRRADAARRESEESLRQSTERRAAILESAIDCIITMDADGRIVEFNPAAEQTFGKSRDQVIGQLVAEVIIPPRLRESHARGLALFRRTGEAKVLGRRIEMPALRADGTEFPIELAITVTTDRSGTPFFTAYLRDISARKSAEAEREALLQRERGSRQQAVNANRMKDEFLATLSHELRTPLNAVLGWAQLLRSGQSDPAEISTGLETIERNARVQAQLIEDLLDMSRIVSGKVRLEMQQVELVPMIEAALESVRPAANAKKIRLSRALDSAAPPVNGDSARLQQIVWNLLSNAIKFTPSGGRVDVKLQRVQSHVQISVSDTGVGIAPEFLPHMFDRFRQSDPSTTRKHVGLGLGLAIVKHLTELHGGTVEGDSAGENQGAVFTVRLPIAPLTAPAAGRTRPQANQSADEQPSSTPHLQGIKVLVVDDEPDARDLLSRLLQTRGANVTTAGSAQDALCALQKDRPDVLLSDIGMPGEDGYALIRKLRQLPPDQGGRTPAAAITAFARIEDRTRAMLSGFQVHIAKPVEPSELIAVVASLAGRVEQDRPES